MTLPVLALAALALHFFRKQAPALALVALALGASTWMGLSRGGLFQNLGTLLTVGYALALAVTALSLPVWLTLALGAGAGFFTVGNPSMLGCLTAVALAASPFPRESKAVGFVALALISAYTGPSQPIVLAAIALLLLYPMQTFFVTLAGVGWASVFPLSSWLVAPPEGWLSSNGRVDMWAKALREWPGMDVWQGAFFGSGPGTARLILPGMSPDPLRPFTYLHSDWLDILLTWGLVGFLLCGLCYVLTLEKAKPDDRLALILFGAAMAANYPWHEPGFALLGAGLLVKTWASE